MEVMAMNNWIDWENAFPLSSSMVLGNSQIYVTDMMLEVSKSHSSDIQKFIVSKLRHILEG